MLNYYRKILASKQSGHLESNAGVDLDLSEKSINRKLDLVNNEMIHQLNLGTVHETHARKLIEDIQLYGKSALISLRDSNKAPLLPPEQLSATLEAIVKFDGTRPTFLINNGEVNLSSSITTSWQDSLYVSRDLLRQVIPSVGRISSSAEEGSAIGTGFLISETLLVTNRHVLQKIACRNDEKGKWEFFGGASVDFVKEYGSTDSDSVEFVSVVFAGPNAVRLQIDHQINDIAIFELNLKPKTLIRPFKLRSFAPREDIEIYTIGYPSMPDIRDYPLDVLDSLFEKGFDVKRLAPGKLMGKEASLPEWSFCHDATTLGGNSGSVVMEIGKEDVVAGLHYGGASKDPRRNYAHNIALLEEEDNYSGLSLGETLRAYHINM